MNENTGMIGYIELYEILKQMTGWMDKWKDECMYELLREWQNTNESISYYTIEQIWDDI